jgi:RNA polymerase sigma-70 factor (ECF subfamily)
MSHRPDENSEALLLDRARNGDEQAFLSIYRRLHPPIFRFALQMSGSPAVADDVTQEVFLALLRDGFGFDPARGPLSSYLYGVARKLILRHLERARDGVSLATGEEDCGPELAASEADALADLTRRESIEAVRLAVLSLPPRYREVVVLCDLQELDYAQAAATLDCAVGTVRSRLHRGRALLLEKLSRGRGPGPALDGLRPARCLL